VLVGQEDHLTVVEALRVVLLALAAAGRFPFLRLYPSTTHLEQLVVAAAVVVVAARATQSSIASSPAVAVAVVAVELVQQTHLVEEGELLPPEQATALLEARELALALAAEAAAVVAGLLEAATVALVVLGALLVAAAAQDLALEVQV